MVVYIYGIFVNNNKTVRSTVIGHVTNFQKKPEYLIVVILSVCLLLTTFFKNTYSPRVV